MSQQRLDVADVGTAFEHVRGAGVAEQVAGGVRVRILEAFELGRLDGLLDDPRQLLGLHALAVLGEEHGSVDGTTGRRWVIDPIDGTHAFTHGVGLYSNLLYLEDDEGPAIGVIYVPVLDEIVAAGRGLGCFFNGEPCRVSDHATFEAAVLTTSGFDYWDEDMLVRARNSELKLRTWGDGYGYLLVATGRAHAMVDPVINFWDIAPCQVIIPEAGGRITMLDGTDDPHGESCIATNGVLHDAIVESLNGRRADA